MVSGAPQSSTAVQRRKQMNLFDRSSQADAGGPARVKALVGMWSKLGIGMWFLVLSVASL
jgi:hypothetical protein